MIVKNYSEVNDEKLDMGSGNIHVRWLINDSTGRNFAMRRYSLDGVIPVHKHSHEHEVFFLEGKGEVTDQNGLSRKVGSGDFAYISPNEPHGFKSIEGSTLTFLCMVPIKRGETEML